MNKLLLSVSLLTVATPIMNQCIPHYLNTIDNNTTQTALYVMAGEEFDITTDYIEMLCGPKPDQWHLLHNNAITLVKEALKFAPEKMAQVFTLKVEEEGILELVFVRKQNGTMQRKVVRVVVMDAPITILPYPVSLNQ